MSLSPPHPQFASALVQHRAVRLGMWVFLATELMFFGPLFGGYLQGRVLHAAAFAAASRHTNVVAGTLNTLVLLTSSLCVALAVEAVQRRDARGGRRGLWCATLLGLAFLAIKAWEYAGDWREGLLPGAGFRLAGATGGTELFYWLYFAMTGLHALHLTIGMLLLAVFAVKLRAQPAGALGNAVEVAGLYWHFVDVVWVFLYPLLYLVGRHG